MLQFIQLIGEAIMERNFVDVAVAEAQRIMDQHAAALLGTRENGEIQVLEAGCGDGSWTWFFWPERAHLTGIDVSAKQMENNHVVQERIVGDLQQYRPPSAAYDIITCCNVLEHIEHPELALSNLTDALKPGGILIVAAPLRDSFKGLVARLTPHRFHVFYYKYVMGDPNAGRPDMFPFPTYLKKEMSQAEIANFADEHGMSVISSANWKHPSVDSLRDHRTLLYYLVCLGGLIAKLISFGSIKAEVSEFIMVLKKNYQEPTQANRSSAAQQPQFEGLKTAHI
jgi:2-polyprenyl-3-methyl-5-hydroxy-6-metoxy-1,4-benzoquinol methylase